ncbi:unnamed protein product [Pieris macdunnoughi]|uniref:Uncharacterized protein n=1 Tax=Pieris macdunnoughi TaxID=345717 RepID=A0A821XIF7_9NEOP|nr:unnamed protein product [Pieris macdunnoughi]
MYQFSPSSTALLERCIELAKQNEQTNAWKERFLVSMDSKVSDNAEETLAVCNLESSEEMEIIVNPTYTDDKYREIEADPILNINILFEDANNGELLTKLAQNIDDTCAEKLFNHMMKNHINLKYIEIFFKYFLPHYFKRHQSRLCLDVMINAYNVYPAQFHIILKNMVNDETSTNILQEFVSTLSPSKQTDILKIIMASNISSNTFMRHMFSIHACYKNCTGIENIDNFIFVKLKEASGDCVTDKQYGRLLFTYLQNKKDCNNIHLKKIVEIHRSPFRRPCLNLLNGISEKSC